ncbi:DUF1045 domain-containing protein [Tropicimonas sp. TH_r6]|uniref:DUF1045 domain-containing protein n=1 Tax=Tropicimonas sp. TH_r6 TaxID=3082085 RepID=UPI0029537B51|nr:DUF1045 domain-containing protein [Tropicimonas sp. TH_r6]MDV7142924.1 DUF1045 domain-containing protein [Tropicimonas sp. TH_r6]
MDGFTRFALYYAPPDGPLADFGASWLGWNPRSGRKMAHPALPGLPMPIAEITREPRKYGFHGTLKPPFRLKPGFDVSELHNATEALAATLPPVLLDGLKLSKLDSFLALLPEGDTTQIALLAARVLEALDGFRAAPEETELEQRRAAGLSPRQEVLLQQWGHPYVMEEFRFHLTLSGKLSPTEADAVAGHLRPVIQPLLPRPFRIREICLFGEGQDGRFHHLHRYTLSG